MDKHKVLAEKFERIAHADLLADEFNEALQVNKGLHAYQELTNLPLTEASYRAQIALLNAALIDQFEGACYNLGNKRLHENFTRFDQLITASASLPQTENLKDFQRYAKSCLYYRIGDFLLLSLKPAPEPFDKSQFVAALCAYAIALDHLCGGNEAHEVHSSAEAFNILELKALLAHNALVAEGFTPIAEFLRDKKLGPYLESLVFSQKPNAGVFVKSDFVKHVRLLDLYKISSKKMLTQIWNVRRNGVFFKRFLWIRARLPADDDEFLNTSVTRFSEFPQEFSSIYDVQDFSLFDLKVLVYRMSIYAEALEIKPRTAKQFVYPSHFQPSSNKHLARIWSIVNTLLDNGTYTRDKATERITFVNMLEEIRQHSAYESDATNLVKTANYLWLKISRSEHILPKNRQMLMELFERYANAVLKTKYSGQMSTLFPPNNELETLQESVICDTANFLFAQYYLGLSDKTKAASYLESISKVGQSKDDVKALIEKIQKRSSENASPNSVDSFQMVDEVKIEPVEESTMEESFMTCNQTTKTIEVATPSQTSTANFTQQADETIVNVSKLREEVEAETKSDFTRKILSDVLDNFMAISLQKTRELNASH